MPEHSRSIVSVTAALQSQERLQHRIMRSLDNFKKIGRNNLDIGIIQARISTLQETWKKFEDGHDGLMLHAPKEALGTETYFKDNHFDLVEDAFQGTLDYMQSCLSELEGSVSPNQSLNRSTCRADVNTYALSHLPIISITPYDGSYDSWEHFRDKFTSLIIENKEFTNFTKMHYLTSNLTGRALDCVKDLKITSESFPIAWEKLRARFESKRRLLRTHLDELQNIPIVSKSAASLLMTFYDKIDVTIASLNNLGRTPEQIWSDYLVYSLSQKLDSRSRSAWSLESNKTDEPPSFDQFLKFVQQRIRILEDGPQSSTEAQTCSKKDKWENSHGKSNPVKVHTSATAADVHALKAGPECPECKGRHLLTDCTTFRSATTERRRDLAKLYKRCFNCLSPKHGSRDCKSKYSCRLCQQRHHTLLHSTGTDSNSAATSTNAETVAQTTVVPTSADQTTSESSSAVQALSAHVVTPSKSSILLATASVRVTTEQGRSLIVRALIDQGSEMSFISEHASQVLRCKRFRMPISIAGVGGVDAGTYNYVTTVSISPHNAPAPSLTMTALILKTLTNYAPKRPIDLGEFSHLSDIQWADKNPSGSEPIHLLLGADLYGDLLLGDVRKGASGEPIAQNSIFGWFISGSVRATSSEITSQISVHHCCENALLDDTLRRFWEIEELPRKLIPCHEDERCEAFFQSSHSRNSDGRYVVRLPLKAERPIAIGLSKNRALQLQSRLARQLQTQPEIKAAYQTFLSEYEELGHMRRVRADAISNLSCVYIPHHPVLRADSATTKLRVVFNASCLTSNGTSLNDHLMCGPKLQLDLPTVILRWRAFRFVYNADIAKMYRQILVDEKDVDLQRIFWQPVSSQIPLEYQLLTVTYGMNCAPYLALRVIKQLANDEENNFPAAVQILRNHTYVDDVLFGGDTLDELKDLRQQVISVFKSGGFELRKWASNASALLTEINESNHGLACGKSLSEDDQLKVLGIQWHPASDGFRFMAKIENKYPRTKRSILSAIARLYDPCGWATPVIVRAKIFMQQLWREKIAWDDPLPEALYKTWTQIYSRLDSLNQVQVPRWLGLRRGIQRIELHGFADASNAAYAAVVYSRITLANDDTCVSLITGKSRVAPLKPLSVPRLELSAALLLAQLLRTVEETLHPANCQIFCWTDSSIVLAWLAREPTHWKTFVANRVAEISSLLPKAVWRHVPTHMNPADCASRGLFGDELADHKLWMNGPSWLRISEAEWPNRRFADPEDEALEARKRGHSATIKHWTLEKQFSSWPKLLRVTAYLFKFVDYCRRRRLDTRSLFLAAEEHSRAHDHWIRYIQQTVFAEDLARLTVSTSVAAKSKLLSLTPFLDDQGILRVGGRLRHSAVAFSRKHPILLDSHPLVNLLIEHVHRSMLHAGIQLTLNAVRQNYWILRSRSLVRAVIHRCLVCVRERAATPTQLMGNLPKNRVTPSARSFQHCGVDYAGPFLTRYSPGRGAKLCKSYVALFVCLSTRAVHLELVRDYSSTAFLDAFTRFCSRRGLPQTVYSDNGNTFVGADRELSTAYRAAIKDPELQNRIISNQVEWRFIPPSAPHFGGLWEAGVHSFKHHLRRVAGTATFTFEEFTTLLCRIEACLNSRPLAPLSDAADNFDPLTPGHFLIGSALCLAPEPSVLHLNENRLLRWQLLRQKTERFWQLWSTDYLNTLQQRSKWRVAQPNITVGQLVLIKNPLLPPCKWALGRVTQCHAGPDALVRVVSVKTSLSEVKRPIGKLCPLPVDVEPPRSNSASTS